MAQGDETPRARQGGALRAGDRRRRPSGDVCAEPGKSEIARDRLRQPSTNQIAVLTRATGTTYQPNPPGGGNHPVYIVHRTRTRTKKNTQHTAAHATIGV